MLCKDGPQHTIKIADVLCQLLQLGMMELESFFNLEKKNQK